MNKLTLQVLISTMNQKDFSLLEKMNIQSDAIVVNQCDKNCIEEFKYKEYLIKWISLKERGVGLSRNTALMRADADIVLFADDDVVYNDGAIDKVISEFGNNPNMDLIVFNLVSQNPNRPETIVKKPYRLHWYNCLKFGAFRIAIRRQSIIYNNIYFSLLFGGGTVYQAGEDNLFIVTCLRNKLKCFASKIAIGTVEQKESTWFKGYNEKYYYDRGALFYAMFPGFYKFFLIALELKEKKSRSEIKFIKKLQLASKGVKEFKERKKQ